VASHLCGYAADAETEVPVSLDAYSLGVQRMRLAAPGVAMRVSALTPERHAAYYADIRRLLDHTALQAVQWINITQPVVQFRTVWKNR